METARSTPWPTISIITVNLNGRDHLEALMASIASLRYPADRLEVIVVDNASTDESVAFLQREHPSVKLIRNSANEGFARPNNQAAAVATGTYLALLNNDMRMAPDWLKRMVEFIEASPPDVACVGSRILNWDGTTVDFIRGTMAYNGMGFQPGYQARVGTPEAEDYPDELLFACGGAMLVRKDVYLEAGGFDEDYFAYYEDVDLGWRLWVLGYRVRFCPEAVVYHRHNGTSGRFDWRKKVVLFERNAMFSVVKNYDEATLNRIWPAVLLLAFKRMAVRSGINREEFRFGPRPPEPDVPRLGRKGRLLIMWGSIRRLGVRGAVKKGIVLAAKIVLKRWGGQSYEHDATMPIMREAYATVVGVEDFIDYLPRVMAKRRDIQSRRKRTDAEIFRVFGEPLDPVERRGGYDLCHVQVTRDLGVEALFAAAERELAAKAR